MFIIALMQKLLDIKFLRILSEHLEEASALELNEAFNELVDSLINISTTEKEYATQFRYFSFIQNRLKTNQKQLTGEKKILFVSN